SRAFAAETGTRLLMRTTSFLLAWARARREGVEETQVGRRRRRGERLPGVRLPAPDRRCRCAGRVADIAEREAGGEPERARSAGTAKVAEPPELKEFVRGHTPDDRFPVTICPYCQVPIS